MRIISGKFKGKKIFNTKSLNTRPLRDYVKENIFNILTHGKFTKFNFEKAHILDLYAGIGSFGIECLSRNVGQVVFVDALNNRSMDQILENQKNAMISLLRIKKIPFLSIEIKKRNEETRGELFSYFILETVFLAESMKINAFNQPAVEQLKILVKKNLFKKNQK